MARHIAVLGSYGTTNIGDQAILTAMLDLIAQYSPDSRVTVIAPYPDRVSSVHDVCALSARRRRDVLRKIKCFLSADLLIVGGGGLLQDNRQADWLRGMVSAYVSQALFAKLCGCKLALVGVSIGPLSRVSSRRLTSLICRTADVIVPRDKESMELALRLGGHADRMFPAADLALCLEIAGASPSIVLRMTSSNKRYCVLNLRPSYAKNDEKHPFGIPRESIHSLCRLLDWLVGVKDLDVVFVPFDTRHDVAVGQYLAPLLADPSRYHVCTQDLSVNSIVSIMKHAEITVGMRLHSLIFSFLAGTAVIPLVYDTKVASFAHQIGIHDVFEISDLEFEALRQAFTSEIEALDVGSSDARERLGRLQELIHFAFQETLLCT